MMKGARVDPGTRRVVAQPGLLWQDLDAETQAFGLAATGGLVSTTGVSGFTLGGGIGWLVRKQGLACDHLVSADVVTADGRLVRAGADGDPELLWGLRGGGGNFGVVTALELELQPVGPMVYGGIMVFAGERAADVCLVLRRLDRRRPARRAHDDPQPDDRAAGAVPARVDPRQAGRDRRRLLRRPRRRGRARARARPRPGRPGGRPPAAAALHRDAAAARPAVGPRRPQPHEGRLPGRPRLRRHRRAAARLGGQALADERAARAPHGRRGRPRGARQLRLPASRRAVRRQLHLALDRRRDRRRADRVGP